MDCGIGEVTVPLAIDRLIPQGHFSERHATTIHAPPALVLETIPAVRMGDDPLIERLLRVRAIPSRLLGREAPKPPKDFGYEDFVALAHDDRQRAWGAIGAFWKPAGGVVRGVGAEDFAALPPPGTAKLVWSYHARLLPSGGTHLETETRIVCADAASRRAMLAYWLVIRIPSGIIRRRLLARIKAEAERRFAQAAASA
jgi:hypothetical protein